MEAIIFDFDGVIHNTFDFHRGKIKEYFGVELSADEYRDMHNGNFYAHGVAELKEADWSGYSDFIRTDQTNLRIDAKMKEGLLALREHYALFIITSAVTRSVLDYLESNGLGGVFREVLGMDLHASKVDKFKMLFKKYALRSEDCLFVTDTLGDILEANEVGVKTIAVDFGFHGRETLKKGKPFKIVSSVAQLFEEVMSNT